MSSTHNSEGRYPNVWIVQAWNLIWSLYPNHCHVLLMQCEYLWEFTRSVSLSVSPCVQTLNIKEVWVIICWGQIKDQITFLWVHDLVTGLQSNPVILLVKSVNWFGVVPFWSVEILTLCVLFQVIIRVKLRNNSLWRND